MRIFIAVASACLLGCSATQGISLSAAQGGARALRFAVLPVNAVTPVSTELSVATDRVLGQITRYLQVQGRERLTIELPRTRQLWRASTAEVERADSLPNLEIEADDVKCSHGATISQLDSEALFYLLSRGMSRHQAERLVVVGFLGDVLSRLPLGGVVEKVTEAISRKIQSHG